MHIRICGLVNDSIVDGPGLRLTVFTQGCPHHCPGCHNPQSHSFEGGQLRDIDEILTMAKENPLLDGITLSGGEPFCQPEACAQIAVGAHKLGLNVWCYTGYSYENLLASKEKRALLEQVDILVDGPFILEERSLDIRFRGSKNQRIIDVKNSLLENRVVLSSLN